SQVEIEEGIPHKYAADFALIDGILYKASYKESGRLWLLCVPKVLQHHIFKEIHESDLGHQGYHKTLQIIKSRFTWPKLDQTVRRFLKHCQTCLFHNNNYEVSKGYTPVIAPFTPFTRIAIDFIGEFKRTQRNKKAALTIVDQSTRWLEAYATKDMSTASAIYGLGLWIAKYTQPKVIVCDNGAGFSGKDFKNFCQEKGIDIIFTSPNHPSSNDSNSTAQQAETVVSSGGTVHSEESRESVGTFHSIESSDNVGTPESLPDNTLLPSLSSSSVTIAVQSDSPQILTEHNIPTVASSSRSYRSGS
ncbi:unnamed protein product, partial [Allacma fusca]